MTKKKLYDYYIMPRKTHKRQRKQNGGNGGMYLSLKIKKLREIADNLHNKNDLHSQYHFDLVRTYD